MRGDHSMESTGNSDYEMGRSVELKVEGTFG